MLFCFLCIHDLNLTPLCSLSTSRQYADPVLFTSAFTTWHHHATSPPLGRRPLCFPLYLQFICCPTLSASASSIWCHYAFFSPLESMLSCFLCIHLHNLTPSYFFFIFSLYVVLLSLHPHPQSNVITLPLHLQKVCCPILLTSASSI